MLEKEHYLRQIARLGKNFEWRPTSEFLNLLWPKVKDLTNCDFTDVADAMIGSRRKAPILVTFMEYAERIRKVSIARDNRSKRKDAFTYDVDPAQVFAPWLQIALAKNLTHLYENKNVALDIDMLHKEYENGNWEEPRYNASKIIN